MQYDVAIIGAGLSGLAAGIRLAYFGYRVCILEKHYAYGGLNSYYTMDRRPMDVGLHAVTNFVEPSNRKAPLSKLLRQLRLSRDDFKLRPQWGSLIHFSDEQLAFSNDIALLTDEVNRAFPKDAEGFRRLISDLRAFNDTRLDQTPQSARDVLGGYLKNPQLIEMLLCPIMYYGCPTEHDIDFASFVTLFKSILLEGFARPVGGSRVILKALVKKFRACGGQLLMRREVDRIVEGGGKVTQLLLKDGTSISCDCVLSSAGHVETMRLLAPSTGNAAETPSGSAGADGSVGSTGSAKVPESGALSFVETILILDQAPSDLDHRKTIVFYNDGPSFNYARPEGLIDVASGVLCSPNNYEGHESLPEGIVRLTWLANYDRWAELDKSAYLEAKEDCLRQAIERISTFIPNIAPHIVATDLFTPLTIERFTGREKGAVYGTAEKIRDGRTHLTNLFLCGTDQGFLGIIGAMLSGITIANLHILSKD